MEPKPIADDGAFVRTCGEHRGVLSVRWLPGHHGSIDATMWCPRGHEPSSWLVVRRDTGDVWGAGRNITTSMIKRASDKAYDAKRDYWLTALDTSTTPGRYRVLRDRAARKEQEMRDASAAVWLPDGVDARQLLTLAMRGKEALGW